MGQPLLSAQLKQKLMEGLATWRAMDGADMEGLIVSYSFVLINGLKGYCELSDEEFNGEFIFWVEDEEQFDYLELGLSEEERETALKWAYGGDYGKAST